MDCNEIRGLFSDAYDGEAEAEAKDILESHLRECAECAGGYEKFRAFFSEVKGLPAAEFPGGLHEDAMRRVRGAETKKISAAAFAFDKRKTGRSFAYRRLALGFSGAAACFILISLFASGLSGLYESAVTNSSAPLAERSLVYDAGPAEVSVSSAATEAAGIIEIRADAAVPEDAPAITRTMTERAFAPAGDSGLIESDGLSELGYFERTFHINIEAAKLEEVEREINNLSGYNLSASSWYYEHGGFSEYRRRTALNEYEAVKETLRGLGVVHYEHEYLSKLSDELADLEARFGAKRVEAERLKTLLGESKTMDVLVAVERRLGRVETERDELRGRLNQLYETAARPLIVINISEQPREPEPLPEEKFFDRLRESFVRSVNGTVEFMEDFVVWFSGALLPIIIIAAVAVLAIKIIIRRRRRKLSKGGEDK